MGLAVEKGPDAFRTISEVAEDLDLPQHVLRFWETRFAQIKPLKRGGGRRYYRPDDIDLLRGIRQLLYGDGYTIRGVQQILREQGVRHVQSIGRAVEAEEVRPAPPLTGGYGSQDQRSAQRSEGGRGLIDLLPSLRSARPTPELPRVVEVPIPQRPATHTVVGEDEMPPFPFRRPGGDAPMRSLLRTATDQEMPAATVRGSHATRPLEMRMPGDAPRL
ncbi:MAG: MerR family transcriptional regulator, partial [Xanthobacteraceae bacterium]